ncbi:MAG: aminomethyl-transferring glycine dehydrogenase [Flammeovirgaceae bacterium]|nr:aminomethyl-transferring glycine dehydrogenase [Flammeovirgaceae bacterium]
MKALNLNYFDQFENRHNSLEPAEIQEMLEAVKAESLEELIEQTIPSKIRLENQLDLPKAKTEFQFLNEFRKIASKNKIFKSYIGLGYHDCITPPVILRNILENPGWYTAYTPYQAEIAQGRLEMLLNFQTLITDLTHMDIANASLLDEGTAAAEAMSIFQAFSSRKKKGAFKFFVSNSCHPQTIDVLRTRAKHIGITLVTGNHLEVDLTNPELFGVLVQYPMSQGNVMDYTNFISAAHESNVLVAVAADLLSLTLLKAPGEMGADVVVGSAQRFGVPLGYGGPHAGFMAAKEDFKRLLPGRIIGVSKDADGNTAYRMALQTREQHIKRERATSNICTAQVLLAVMASAYAVYHGANGLKSIGEMVYGLTRLLAISLGKLDIKVINDQCFDTLQIDLGGSDKAASLKSLAEERGINLRYLKDGTVGVSLNEVTRIADVVELVQLFADAVTKKVDFDIQELASQITSGIDDDLQRKTAYLTHPVFNTHHSEHEMLRYLKQLENKDLSLVHSMISLGSCTMKLNATTEMIPVTWPEIGKIHPFVPLNQAEGYQEIIGDLGKWLEEITGFAGISFQPNSGAQGEYAGLLVIKAYHEAKGETHRNVVIIPSSAHGTNPASAVMAGMKVVITKCDENGNIDLEDLMTKAEEHKDDLSALMVTYPSTHGVFEEEIIEICNIIHTHGGRVYMDGANMNAQVGLTNPANIGADVCHLNLHKTFCIPHGGGGPGMGPIGVVEDLVPYLPGHVEVELGGEQSIHAVSAAPWGSASILPISYAYITMMGTKGLENATKHAILNANYMKSRLENHYPVLFTGKKGRVAHEMIVDCRAFKAFGIEVEDIAKRLMDYGFHAPTVSFPVAGTLMIEPTESETKAEIDRFCDAMIAIRKEVQEVENGTADKMENVLKNAPHTANMVMADNWEKPYSREKAAYPLPYIALNKFWPSVRRINNAFGDRNLICSCLPVEDFIEESA